MVKYNPEFTMQSIYGEVIFEKYNFIISHIDPRESEASFVLVHTFIKNCEGFIKSNSWL